MQSLRDTADPKLHTLDINLDESCVRSVSLARNIGVVGVLPKPADLGSALDQRARPADQCDEGIVRVVLKDEYDIAGTTNVGCLARTTVGNESDVRTFQSFSSGPGSTRPIGRALTPPVSASVTSQQYRTRAIAFAAAVRSRLTSISSRSFFARDIDETFIQQRTDFVSITCWPHGLDQQVYMNGTTTIRQRGHT